MPEHTWLITHNLLDGIIKIYLERLAQDELSNFNYTLSQYQRSNTLLSQNSKLS